MTVVDSYRFGLPACVPPTSGNSFRIPLGSRRRWGCSEPAETSASKPVICTVSFQGPARSPSNLSPSHPCCKVCTNDIFYLQLVQTTVSFPLTFLIPTSPCVRGMRRAIGIILHPVKGKLGIHLVCVSMTYFVVHRQS